jgi:CheY-like chemotaxis protein
VLVADGYDDARVPIARYLARFGFHVLEASTATEAVEILNRYQPRVILSGLHGPQAKFLYSRLESPPSTARLGLIVLLSSIDDPVPREATGVLTKPFMLRSMLDELRREIRAGSAPDRRRRPVKNGKNVKKVKNGKKPEEP